jgi:hypothetical protein
MCLYGDEVLNFMANGNCIKVLDLKKKSFNSI